MGLSERDRKVIWHPFTPQKYMPDPIPIVKAEGIYLIDDKGKKYIDAISSWWVNLHGHSHPYIARKVYEQANTLEQVIFAGFTHLPAIELAELLLTCLPGPFSKVFYSDNGSTSTEVAIKMALQYWWNQGMNDASAEKPHQTGKRNKILAFKNAYHGDTFGAMSVSDRSVFTIAFRDKLFDVLFIDAPETTSPSVNDLPFDEIACFIYEPLVQGAGGMKMYNCDGLNKLLTICKKHDVICIADEVMTGFGRTGKMFASEYCEVKPDIICLSKGLTGGTMALGVTACNEKIYDAFVSDDKLRTFFHGHSFTANPLACTAALASLELFQIENCRRKIDLISRQHELFIEGLKSSNKLLHTKNHRQLGTILAFEVDSGKDDYLNSISSAISEKALQKGLYIRPLGNTVYLMPPYCINEDELQQVYAIIIDILTSL